MKMELEKEPNTMDQYQSWPFGQPNLPKYVPINAHTGHDPNPPPKKEKKRIRMLISKINTLDLLDLATNFLLADVVGSDLDIQTHLADSDLMMMMVLMMT